MGAGPVLKYEHSCRFSPGLGSRGPACPVPGVPLGRAPLTKEALCSTSARTPGWVARVFQGPLGPPGCPSDLCTLASSGNWADSWVTWPLPSPSCHWPGAQLSCSDGKGPGRSVGG